MCQITKTIVVNICRDKIVHYFGLNTFIILLNIFEGLLDNNDGFTVLNDESEDGNDTLDDKFSNEPILDVLGRIDEIELDFNESGLERIDVIEPDEGNDENTLLLSEFEFNLSDNKELPTFDRSEKLLFCNKDGIIDDGIEGKDTGIDDKDTGIDDEDTGIDDEDTGIDDEDRGIDDGAIDDEDRGIDDGAIEEEDDLLINVKR